MWFTFWPFSACLSDQKVVSLLQRYRQVIKHFSPLNRHPFLHQKRWWDSALCALAAIIAHACTTSAVLLERGLDSLRLGRDDPIAETVSLAWKSCQDTLKRQDLPSARCWKPSPLLRPASETGPARPCDSHGPPPPHTAGRGQVPWVLVVRNRQHRAQALAPNPLQHPSSLPGKFAACASFPVCQRKQMFLIYH